MHHMFIVSRWVCLLGAVINCYPVPLVSVIFVYSFQNIFFGFILTQLGHLLIKFHGLNEPLFGFISKTVIMRHKNFVAFSFAFGDVVTLQRKGH